jgi:hypothetical protein
MGREKRVTMKTSSAVKTGVLIVICLGMSMAANAQKTSRSSDSIRRTSQVHHRRKTSDGSHQLESKNNMDRQLTLMERQTARMDSNTARSHQPKTVQSAKLAAPPPSRKTPPINFEYRPPKGSHSGGSNNKRGSSGPTHMSAGRGMRMH